MSLTWTDSREIAMALAEKFPELDPQSVRFTDLHRWVMELDEFSDNPKRCNEKILEAIILAWRDESE